MAFWPSIGAPDRRPFGRQRAASVAVAARFETFLSGLGHGMSVRIGPALSHMAREWQFGSPRPTARARLEMTVADNPPSEIQTLIETHINAFNTQSSFSGAFLAMTRSSLTASRPIAG